MTTATLQICDLCGEAAEGEFGPAKRFGMCGKLCPTCTAELAAERAVRRKRIRAAYEAKRRYINTSNPDGRLYCGPGSYRLFVIDAEFTEADFTPKLAARLFILKHKRGGRA